MINLNEATITEIQFFDNSYPEQINAYGDFKEVEAYSANIVIDDKVVVQIGGDGDNAYKASIPSGDICCWNDEAAQDEFFENVTEQEVSEFLEAQGIENSFSFLYENNTFTL